MLLSKPDILKEIASGRVTFAPAVDASAVDQVSIDLSLGHHFTTLRKLPGYVGSVRVDPSIFGADEFWERAERDTFVLDPGGFVLAQTLQTVTLPNDIAGLVEGRSSWARLGIGIHVTAPKIDPGFSAPITLEMANHGSLRIELRAGIDKPAQLMLCRVTPLDPADLYGASEGDIFQYQTEPIPRKK